MGNVHGDGQHGKPEADGRRVIRQDGWELSVWNDMLDDEPRIRDVDLARRLGFENVREIRRLIKRNFEERSMPQVRVTVTRTRIPNRNAFREDAVNEYWLTEEEALFVVTRSRTTIATTLTKEMIRVFVAVRRGLLSTTPTQSQVLALLLSPEFLPSPPGGRFKEELFRQLFRLKGKPYPRGLFGAPQGNWVGNLIVELFYWRLSGDGSLIDELRRRNPANAKGERRHRHHNGLRPEIADGPLVALVDTAIVMMRGFADGAWDEFIVAWDRAYPVRGRTAWLPMSIAPQLPPPRTRPVRARRPKRGPGKATGCEDA